MSLLGRRLEVANVGLDLFAGELELQDVHVERVDWRPPSPAVQGALTRLARHALVIAEQNDVALRITRIYRQYNHIRILQYSPTPQGSTRKDSRPLVRATSSREILPNRHPGAVAL